MRPESSDPQGDLLDQQIDRLLQMPSAPTSSDFTARTVARIRRENSDSVGGRRGLYSLLAGGGALAAASLLALLAYGPTQQASVLPPEWVEVAAMEATLQEAALLLEPDTIDALSMLAESDPSLWGQEI